MKNLDFKIILIENDITKRRDISSRLRSNGFSVEAALSGFHSLALLENNEFNLMLISSPMSDMNALEIISLARTSLTPESLPIVFFYEKNNPLQSFTEQEYFVAGAQDAVLNPDNFNSIMMKIAKYLSATQLKILSGK